MRTTTHLEFWEADVLARIRALRKGDFGIEKIVLTRVPDKAAQEGIAIHLAMTWRPDPPLEHVTLPPQKLPPRMP